MHDLNSDAESGLPGLPKPISASLYMCYLLRDPHSPRNTASCTWLQAVKPIKPFDLDRADWPSAAVSSVLFFVPFSLHVAQR